MIAVARIALVGLLVAAGLVFGVTSAGAANLVANPGFEMACGAAPCFWSPIQSTITSDPVNPHSGSASLAATSSGQQTFSARSACFTVSPSTAYNIGGWYRTTSTAPDVIILDLFEYSDTACGAFVTHGAVDSSVPPVRTGAWTFFQGPVTTGATIHGAALQATAACPVTCPETTTVNYDDVAVQTEPLAVTVFSFSAHRAGKGVLLRWRTGTETNELGFNVYRRQGARRVRVNRRLLPALGAIAGSSYSYRDRRAPRHRALRYWLQDVAVDGTRTWHGPVRVSGA